MIRAFLVVWLLAIEPSASAQDFRIRAIGSGAGSQGATDMVVYNGRLVVGGMIFNFNGSGLKNLVSWDGADDYATLGGLFSAQGDKVHDLCVADDDLLIAGKAQGAAYSVMRWNGQQAVQVGLTFDGVIRELVQVDTTLIAVGHFNTCGGTVVDHVAYWNGTSWLPMGSGVNGGVDCIEVFQDDLYIGGLFTHTSDSSVTLNHLAKWNGGNWQSVLSGLDNNVKTMHATDDSLLISGEFEASGDQTISLMHLASYDGASMAELWGGSEGSSAPRLVEIPGQGIMFSTNHGLYSHEQGIRKNHGIEDVRCAVEFNGQVYLGGQFHERGCDEAIGIGQLVRGTDTYFFDVGRHRYLISASNNNGEDPDGYMRTETPVGSGLRVFQWQSLAVRADMADSSFVMMDGWRNHYVGPSVSGLVNDGPDNIDCSRFDRVYHVDQGAVWDHAANWDQPGYVLNPEVADWPGNGDLSVGEPATVAPFEDIDGDGVYEPMSGDYPLIKGETATYTVFNDLATRAYSVGCMATPLIDVHSMFYGYHASGSPLLDNCMFQQIRIVNRSWRTYDSLFVGISMNFWNGTQIDERLACDTLLNIGYSFNGDGNDGTIPNGYGIHPPAYGVVGLNAPLFSFFRIQGDPVPNEFPESCAEMSNFLGGLYGNGQVLVDPFTQDTSRYMYLGDPVLGTGWTELAQGLTPGSRTALMSWGPFLDLGPNEEVCFEVAFVFAQDTLGDHLASAQRFKEMATELHAWYAQQPNDCSTYPPLGDIPLVPERPELFVFPNPTSGSITVEVPRRMDGMLQVYSSDGVLCGSARVVGDHRPVQFDLNGSPPGVYTVVFTAAGFIGQSRFVHLPTR